MSDLSTGASPEKGASPESDRRTEVVAVLRGLFVVVALLGLVYGLEDAHVLRRPFGPTFALGFLLVAGVAVGRLARLVGLPKMTGYLAVGVIFGPSATGVVDEGAMSQLSLVNALALALIALKAGAELTLDMLQRSLRSLLAATLGHSVVLPLGMTALFFACTLVFDLFDGTSTLGLLSLATVWGALAVSKAPADVLAILDESGSKGPVSEHALGVVVLLDVVVLVLFATAMMFAKAMLLPGGEISASAFVHLGEELLVSVASGTTFGLVIAIYYRVVGREKLLFTLLMGYGVTAFSTYFHYDTLLVFVVAGFTVMNLTKQGHALVETVDEIGAAVMVVFFATAGAQLNLSALWTYGPVALTLAVGRMAFTYLSSQLGHRLANDAPLVRTYAFTAFIPQAGVTIGLAAIASRALPEHGELLSLLVIGVIGINELVGPVAFKLALGKAGEIPSDGSSTAKAEASPDDGEEPADEPDEKPATSDEKPGSAGEPPVKSNERRETEAHDRASKRKSAGNENEGSRRR